MGYGNQYQTEQSRPARALWIEMISNTEVTERIAVEAREGLVD